MKTDCPYLFVLVALLLLSCSTSNQKERLQFSEKGRSVPEFNADSALGFIDDQLAFGPRYPGSTGHEQAKAFLREKLESLAGEQNVFTQHFTHIGYEKDTLQLGNIIAAFNTRAADRIMLCAHWDTRPRADKDPEHPEQPILGADDGASGVAVLLELARLFKSNNPPIGVDIILFDGEDYGKEGDNRQYFLGSRYWARNQPVKNYRPRFGILLDMVGGEGAKFPKEAYSYRVAPALVDEIWEIGGQIGFEELFLDEIGADISDDHVVINRLTNIPTIDIIRHGVASDGSVIFAPYWHTLRDDREIIDRDTIKGIGQTMAELVYNRL